MVKKESNFMEALSDAIEKFARPLVTFSETDIVSSVINGILALIPLIMIGSVFLIFYVLGSPSVGTSGEALLPFLTPWIDKFIWMNSATMGLMALFASISIPYNYAAKKGIDQLSAIFIGLTSFILFTVDGLTQTGGMVVSSLGASGLFASIVSSIVSVLIFHWCVKKNITIKMPDTVPPNIMKAFTALVPFALSFTCAWLIRSILGFDFVAFLNNILSPIISNSDSPIMATVSVFIVMILWSVGLHGDNMFLSLLTPFGLLWIDENAQALASGVSSTNLPHILAGIGQTGLIRMTVWTAATWPLIFLMIISKHKHLKTLGWATFTPAIFTIVEPIIYGLPIALNPYLMIPFILSGTVSTLVGYLLMATDFFGKFYVMVPWATPPFLLGPLGTGDWKTALIPIVSFFIGLIIYLPFWRVYIKNLDAEFGTE